jgi:hypothetical protein
LDVSVELINATVQLEQPLADGKRTVGTGFLLSAPTPDGKPRTVLVTATHVLKNMPGAEMSIGYRVQGPSGAWKFQPQKITIRDGATELWSRNPDRDISAIVVEAPAEFAKAAIPLSWLADGEAFKRYDLGPGDEMLALGFPRGVAANSAGFPILRAGRVASYPLAPSREFPTFMLDFSVFPGNSGGPVFMAGGLHRADGAAPAVETPLITGMLTQHAELNSERLEIGIVTQAMFIRDTIEMLDQPGGGRAMTASAVAPPGVPTGGGSYGAASNAVHIAK